MKNRFGKYILFSLIIGTFTCRHPYNPPVIQNNVNYLVVEGVINAGKDAITSVTLSRSQNLSDSGIIVPEPNAQVSIVSQSGNSYALHYTENGVYSTDSLNLDFTTEYQLKITTSDGKSYASDFIPVKITPEIDSLTWEQKEDDLTNKFNVNIFVNTHDPQNNTRYYRWDYVETWEHYPVLTGAYGLKDGMIFVKDESTQTDSCWTTAYSQNISIGTSIALNNDVINHVPVATVLQDDERISVKYSILVRQYAITAAAYQFRLNLQRNTQLTGTVFDPQPSQLIGNIHCVTDPNEPVIGYLSASTETEMRLFIDKHQVSDWNFNPPDALCQIRNIPRNPTNFLIWDYPDTAWGPYFFVTGDGINIIQRHCIECQYQGGTTERPAFWQ